MNLKWSIYIISDTEIHFLEYDLIQKNRNRNRGRVVLYIRDFIPYSERTHLISYRAENQSFVTQTIHTILVSTSLMNVIYFFTATACQPILDTSY